MFLNNFFLDKKFEIVKNSQQNYWFTTWKCHLNVWYTQKYQSTKTIADVIHVIECNSRVYLLNFLSKSKVPHQLFPIKSVDCPFS